MCPVPWCLRWIKYRILIEKCPRALGGNRSALRRGSVRPRALHALRGRRCRGRPPGRARGRARSEAHGPAAAEAQGQLGNSALGFADASDCIARQGIRLTSFRANQLSRTVYFPGFIGQDLQFYPHPKASYTFPKAQKRRAGGWRREAQRRAGLRTRCSLC